MTSYECANCGKTGSVPDSFAGRMGTCPKCGQPVALRSVAAEAPAALKPVAQQPAVPPPAYSLPTSNSPARLSPPMSMARGYSPGRPRQRISALGIISLTFGCVALIVALVPVCGMVSMPFSGLGLILGIIGWIIAASRRDTGVGLPIAGVVTCGLAILLTILISAGFVASMGDRSNQFNRPGGYYHQAPAWQNSSNPPKSW